MVPSTRLAVLALSLVGQIVKATYTLDTQYDASNFFQEFNFFNGQDPTQGFVEYVDEPTAESSGLSGVRNGSIYMGVDSVTSYPANGRRSVRVESQKTFTKGLFVADIAHMPTNACGVWPAFWLYGPNWPSSGEIDIIEGVNTQTTNSVTLHATKDCAMSNPDAESRNQLLNSNCGHESGCGQQTMDNQNYGDSFNAIGGGVYAMEWTNSRIAVWFFPRYKVSQDILDDTPDPQLWGPASASFSPGSSCNIDACFHDHKIVFDTTFCGNWAGNVWAQNAECSAHGSSCKDFVAANPEQFADAYWSIESVKVYQVRNSDYGLE